MSASNPRYMLINALFFWRAASVDSEWCKNFTSPLKMKRESGEKFDKPTVSNSYLALWNHTISGQILSGEKGPFKNLILFELLL